LSNGSRIEIAYNDSGSGAVKTVTNISIVSAPLSAHALSFNLGGVSFSTELTIAKSQPSSLRQAQWHSWLPKINFEITLVLFNKYQLSTSVGDVLVPERLDTETYVTDRDLSATAASPPNGGH
jgi:hypothetical protein